MTYKVTNATCDFDYLISFCTEYMLYEWKEAKEMLTKAGLNQGLLHRDSANPELYDNGSAEAQEVARLFLACHNDACSVYITPSRSEGLPEPDREAEWEVVYDSSNRVYRAFRDGYEETNQYSKAETNFLIDGRLDDPTYLGSYTRYIVKPVGMVPPTYAGLVPGGEK